jgi:hypothetical protein
MAVTPDTDPVTKPVALPTEATADEPLVHVPPLVAAVSVVLLPTHKEELPVIDPGPAFTVTTAI